MALETKPGKRRAGHLELMHIHPRLLSHITLVSALLLTCCHHGTTTSQSSPAASSATPSRPLTPAAQHALRAISRLSPENTLAWLKRSESAPASPKPKAFIVVTIDTWSQPGVADGFMRQMSFDPRTNHFWIIETGGIGGRTHWYGPVMVDQQGAIHSAP